MIVKEHEWTILLYAAGNADLSREIFEQFQQIKKMILPETVIIAAQVALAPNSFLDYWGRERNLHPERWVGTRRFEIGSGKEALVYDLGNVDMASPVSLLDFLLWGQSNYPSQRLMLILSGHGAGPLGLLINYPVEVDQASAMSLTAMAKTLAIFTARTGRRIDSVVCDTCFANMIELWSEIALAEGQPALNLLVPLQDVFYCGLPCHDIVNQVICNNRVSKSVEITSCEKQLVAEERELLDIPMESLLFLHILRQVSFLVRTALQSPDALINLREWRNKQPAGSCVPLYEVLSILGTFSLSANIGAISPAENKLVPIIYFPSNFSEYSLINKTYDNLIFSKITGWGELLKSVLCLEE